MNKKILFFDGDGTLWYPKSTKRTQKPFWIYLDDATKDSYLEHLELTPQAVETLRALRSRNIKTVILSTHPHEAAEATAILDEKVRHFAVSDLFDQIIATPEYSAAKGEKILEITAAYDLTPADALMVGDSYVWDYASAQDKGIDAVLINSDYHQANKEEEPVEYLIGELDELLTFAGL